MQLLNLNNWAVLLKVVIYQRWPMLALMVVDAPKFGQLEGCNNYMAHFCGVVWP